MRMFRLRAISNLLSEVYGPVTPVEPPWANKTVLAMHLNGANNGTSFIDMTGKPFTASGNAKTQTAVSRFGDSSAYFDGASDYINTTMDPDFTLSGDFSMEAWVSPALLPAGTADLFGSASTSAYLGSNLGGWVLSLTNGIPRFGYQYNNAWVLDKTFTGSAITAGAFTHLSVFRKSGIIYLALNGVVQPETLSYAGDLVSNASSFRVGTGGGGSTGWYNGYMEDLRIANGYSHYSGNFSVPSGPFTYVLPEFAIETLSKTVLSLKGYGPNLSNNEAFVDSSPINRTITAIGDPTQGSNSPYGRNWSVDFASSSYLSTGANQGSKINLSGAYTFECWVKPSSSGTGCLLSTSSGTATGRAFVLTSLSGVSYQRKDGSSVAIALSKSLAVKKWNHLAFVSEDGIYTKVYLNGVLVGTSVADNSSVPAAFANYQINFGTLYSTNTIFTGQLSNIRFSTIARYTGPFTPSAEPFVYDSDTTVLACHLNRFEALLAGGLTGLTVTGTAAKISKSSPFLSDYEIGDAGGATLFAAGYYLKVIGPMPLGTSEFSVELWCYPTSLASAQTLFSNYLAGTTDTTFRIDIATTGSVQFACPSRITLSTTNKVVLNCWNHISLTRVGTTFSLYINGVLGASTTNSYNLSNSYDFTIGSSDGSRQFLGHLAGLIVQKAALRSGNFTPPVDPYAPDANTELLCNFKNASITDMAARCNVLAVRDTKLNKSITKSGNGSIQFDGSGDWLNVLPLAPEEFLFADDFTIEAWVYFNSVAGSPQTLFGFKSGATYFDFRWYGSNGAWQVSLNGGAGTSLGGSATAATWIHVALVRRSGVIKLYVNGLRTSVSIANTAVLGFSGVAAFIGATWTDENVLNGCIEDLAVHQFAKYTSNFTPKASALIV